MPSFPTLLALCEMLDVTPDDLLLATVATRILPDLYPHFTQIAVTEAELGQLLEPVMAGPSTKFLGGGLGILSLDAGKYVATCAGSEPARVLGYLESSGASGATLIAHFGKPPYGYPADVVKACIAGLLRGAKIRIRPEEGFEITSIRGSGSGGSLGPLRWRARSGAPPGIP